MGSLVKAFVLKPERPREECCLGTKNTRVVQISRKQHGQLQRMPYPPESGRTIGTRFAGGLVFEQPVKPTRVNPNLTRHPSGRCYR